MKRNKNVSQQSLSEKRSTLTNQTRRETKSQMRKSKRRIPEIEKKPPRKRIFLYLKLISIVHLPPSKNMLILKLEQATNHITKLVDQYTLDTTINLTESSTSYPTFSITIEQDSMEDLNNISNNPLSIIIYERKRPKEELYYDEEEEEVEIEEEVSSEEQKTSELSSIDEEKYPDGRPLAIGHIDLLPLFCQKRTEAVQQTYIYPMSKVVSTIYINSPTCLSVWQLYTLLPLLKEVNFCNLAFLTFETIYNIRTALPELEQPMDTLAAHISFRSKVPDKSDNLQKFKLCSFGTFNETILDRQHYNVKWETLLNREINNNESVGVQTGSLLQRSRSFKGLFGTENVDFGFENIDQYEDFAIVSNAVNRYILTDQLARILEDAVAFDEQELIVEIFDKNKPKTILLQGVLDLSIFMYPMINAIRFAVELRSPNPPPPKPSEKNPASGKVNKSKAKSPNKIISAELQSATSEPPKVKTTFAIISICLLDPITSSLNPMANRKVEKCKAIQTKFVLNTSAELLEDVYRQFDDQIGMLIKYIIDHHITSTMQAKNFFCCQVANMVNKIMKMISCDLNIRYPTKTNADFANLMTRVYKELEQRIYGVVQNCNMNKRTIYSLPTEVKLQTFITVMKYMYECGNASMGDFILEKMTKTYSNNTDLNFYLYVYDIEKNRFDDARKYTLLPLKEKNISGEYFSKIMQLYMKYMEDLMNEETNLEALENLLEAMREFTSSFPTDNEGFVLLYCLYKSCGYLPGVAYTRWIYETRCQIDGEKKNLIELPISVWQMYMSYHPTFKTIRGKLFYDVVKTFTKLGTYKFAEIVYLEIANENTDIEKYLMTNTFKILLNSLEPKFTAKTFPTDKLTNGSEIKALNAQVNGNVEFFREKIDGAMKSYSRILDVHDLDTCRDYRLGLLRYGFQMMLDEHYEKAIPAFERSCAIEDVCFVQYFEIGKAYYRLNKYSEAIRNFAKATEYTMHVPDVWGFLALVNLKMGENFKALECWKYAKLEPDNIIGKEVLEELSKINIHDVFQYVDIPK